MTPLTTARDRCRSRPLGPQIENNIAATHRVTEAKWVQDWRRCNETLRTMGIQVEARWVELQRANDSLNRALATIDRWGERGRASWGLDRWEGVMEVADERLASCRAACSSRSRPCSSSWCWTASM